MPHPALIPVADASAATAADAAAMSTGTPSRALMQRAGAAAAAEIALRCQEHLSGGVVVATGSGNNGGDGWVIARSLHAVGISVRVVECVAARSPDAIAERTLAVDDGVPVSTDIASMRAGGERIIVDALLGTGFSAGAPLRGSIAAAVLELRALASDGRTLVGIDLPSG
ncbi:MAG: bifunctional ADP-dependent NAD(P)H-hydrate dehydratase/NAD(P)H-hydrate epimerase, partial [Polaromonas sp.]|nr:bifunctional ADP-dependent NAD(P)H-hydrate dehydratase/NAD(P)H-hydrate epimerase [Gemmatimonadaceae bacterium]